MKTYRLWAPIYTTGASLTGCLLVLTVFGIINRACSVEPGRGLFYVLGPLALACAAGFMFTLKRATVEMIIDDGELRLINGIGEQQLQLRKASPQPVSLQKHGGVEKLVALRTGEDVVMLPDAHAFNREAYVAMRDWLVAGGFERDPADAFEVLLR